LIDPGLIRMYDDRNLFWSQEALMKFLLLVIAVVALCYLSRLELKDQQESESYYCHGVKAGLWPNYKGVSCDQ